VQIKACSANSNPRNAGFFPILNIAEPRPRYVFIFYSEAATVDDGKTHGVYWIIPSDKLAEPGFGNRLKSDNNEGAYRVRLANHSSKSNLVTPRPKYQQYVDAFEAAFGAAPNAGNHDE
jgi:hypothetical protein